MAKPLIYLATPYSHPSPRVRELRFRASARIAGELMKMGWRVFAPIAMTVPIEEEIGNHLMDWWLEHDYAFATNCSLLVVGQLPGWDKSIGVKHEIVWFKKMRKPIAYYDVQWMFEDMEWQLLLREAEEDE